MIPLEELRKVAKWTADQSELGWELLGTPEGEKQWLEKVVPVVEGLPAFERNYAVIYAAVLDGTYDRSALPQELILQAILKVEDRMYQELTVAFLHEKFLAVKELTI